MSRTPPSPDSHDDLPERPSTAEHPVVRQLERAGRDARWHMSRHTLELAISALEGDETPPAEAPKATGKSKRRKRRKRLL